jgi:hypothetical protein
MTDYRDIFKNKPKAHRPFRLTVRAVPGIWHDDGFAWCDEYRFDDMVLTIKFDDIELLGHHRFRTKQAQQWNFDLQDSKQRQTRELVLKLSKQNLYNQINDHGQDPRLIQLSVDIEGFCIDYFIENSLCYYVKDHDVKMGACLMGETGEIRYPIPTPIYRWIFRNSREMEKRYQFFQKS